MSTPVSDNPSLLETINPLARVYTQDETYAGYVVDVAVIQQDMNTITNPDAYRIELSPVFCSYAGFQTMFYRDGQKFQPTKNINKYLSSKDLLLNSQRTISLYDAQCGDCGLDLDGSFNLLKTLLITYEKDLGIASECWDTCSLMEFNSTVSAIKSLTDITGNCGTGIKCSITLNEFFEQLRTQGLEIDTATHKLPLDPSGNLGVYPGLVTAVITANFHSTTPGVKDVIVKWPFVINFTSYTNEDADGNIDGPGGNYPVYYYIENVSGQYRSNDLSYSTVEFSGNGFSKAKEETAILPAYNRYTATQFSKIYYGN